MGLFDFLESLADSLGSRKCPECGNTMINEGGDPDYLVCENCGYSVNRDEYGDDEDEYERKYPLPPDEDDEEDEDDSGEIYDEVYNELED